MSALAIAAAEPEAVALADVTIDPDLQCRANGTQKEVVAEYAAAMARGDQFPPIVVFRDLRGTILANGFHRVAAAILAGLTELPADVRAGSKRDALLYAASADQAVGLRRSTADKRRAVGLVLAACPKWSDRKIADACGVDNKTVGAARKALAPSEEIPQGDSSDAKAPDALVARLSKALDRILKEWPTERRDELRALLSGARRTAGEPVAATVPRPDPRREPEWQELPGGERVQVARVELKKTGGAA